MTRVIDLGLTEAPMITAIAPRESVNDDELRKKYMESVNNGEYKRDDRNIEEIASEQDGFLAQELMDFFGVDIDIYDQGTDALKSLTKSLEDIIQEDLEKSEQNYEKIVEQDAQAGITQISVEDVVNVASEDIFLEKQFEDDKKRMLARLMAEEEEMKRAKERESVVNDTSTSNATSSYDRSGYSGSSYRATSASSTSSTINATNDSTRVAASNVSEDKKVLQAMYTHGVTNMRNAAAEYGEKYLRGKAKPQYFSRRKGIKGLWDRTKAWIKSPRAQTLCKVGMMLCLEVSMAVLTGHFQFNGPVQTLTYIGMLLGVFYIGSELAADGVNINKMAILR